MTESHRNLTQADIDALVMALRSADHCSFTEEERVLIKRFIRFTGKASQTVGIAVIMGILGFLAFLYRQFAP